MTLTFKLKDLNLQETHMTLTFKLKDLNLQETHMTLTFKLQGKPRPSSPYQPGLIKLISKDSSMLFSISTLVKGYKNLR
jgi:hypothetical protein